MKKGRKLDAIDVHKPTQMVRVSPEMGDRHRQVCSYGFHLNIIQRRLHVLYFVSRRIVGNCDNCSVDSSRMSAWPELGSARLLLCPILLRASHCDYPTTSTLMDLWSLPQALREHSLCHVLPREKALTRKINPPMDQVTRSDQPTTQLVLFVPFDVSRQQLGI